MAIVKKMSVGKQNKPMHKNKNGPKMSISKKKDRDARNAETMPGLIMYDDVKVGE